MPASSLSCKFSIISEAMMDAFSRSRVVVSVHVDNDLGE
jgi:hypothetical protein